MATSFNATTDVPVRPSVSIMPRSSSPPSTIRSSGSSTANGSSPTWRRPMATAWPSPIGSPWRTTWTCARSASAARASASASLPLSRSRRSSSKARSKWSSTGFLYGEETSRMSSMPQAAASSTTYWMAGRSTTGSISLGTALVTGRKRVPRPAAGITALRTLDLMVSPAPSATRRLRAARRSRMPYRATVATAWRQRVEHFLYPVGGGGILGTRARRVLSAPAGSEAERPSGRYDGTDRRKPADAHLRLPVQELRAPLRDHPLLHRGRHPLLPELRRGRGGREGVPEGGHQLQGQRLLQDRQPRLVLQDSRRRLQQQRQLLERQRLLLRQRRSRSGDGASSGGSTGASNGSTSKDTSSSSSGSSSSSSSSTKSAAKAS